MKTKFKNSKELLKVFGTIENILKKNKEENKLRYVKLEAVGDKLCIIAKNPYMKLKYIVENTLEIEGDAALYNCKTLCSLLNVLNGEIYIDNNTISNDKCQYTIQKINIEGYPEEIIPNIINRKKINTENFKEAINNVIAATSKLEGNILSGIYIDKNKLVSCDQNRIFIKKLQLEEELENVILSKEIVNEIIKLPFEENIYMSLFGNTVIFEDSNITIASNLLSGKYPKYDMMLPKDIKQEIIFNKKDFEMAINLVSPILNIETNEIDLNIKDSTFLVSTRNNNQMANTKFDVKQSNIEETNVKFNIFYLIDMLKANNEEIKIKTYKDNIGYSFESKDSKQFIMPLIN